MTYRFRYALLAVLAFIGFHVKPLSAAAPVAQTEVLENFSPVKAAINAPEPEKKTQKIKKSKKRKRNRRGRTVTGCFNF